MCERDLRRNLKRDFQGGRCQICTGCGRCIDAGERRAKDCAVRGFAAVGEDVGRRGGLRAVTVHDVWGGIRPIPNSDGRRLVAVDVGTTTIAMQLYGADGRVEADYACVNPQVRFGADVLSRIRAARDSSSAEAMRRGVREEIETGLRRFKPCLRRGETPYIILAGNTTMIYLLMGFDPAELGEAPFTAKRLEALETEIAGAPCVIFPGYSAFVGGDIAAGIHACGMRESTEPILLIDLGTNGEMVLGDRERQIACATAAGPAFEGGANRGVWGADMVHLVARLRQENVVDETGLLADAYFEDGVTIGDVRVTQEAIRAIQLAKGAIGAGIRILMEEYGVGENRNAIRHVVLAGGFGYYLNPEDAARIGLLPSELVPRTRPGGNTALAGALRLGRELLAGEVSGTDGFAAQIPKHLGMRGTEVLNLAEHPDFERLYVEHMNLE